MMFIGMIFQLACVSEFKNREFAPEVQILSPESGAIVNQGESVYLELTVWDDQVSQGGVTVSWSSDIDGLLAEQVPNSDGTLTLVSARLSPGVHSMIVIATDSAGLSAQQPLEIEVNAAPIAPEVRILPEEPQSGEALRAQILGGFDPEGEPVSFVLEWYRNGSLVEMDPNNPDIIPEDTLQKGDVWSLKAWSSDGAVLSDMAYDSVLVGGSPPEITELSVVSDSGDFHNDGFLTCLATASDRDGDEVELSYYWRIEEGGIVSENIYEGSTLQLSSELASATARVYCDARALDEDGMLEKSLSTQLSNRAPEIISHIIEPSAGVRAGDWLVCDLVAEDPDGDSVDVSYRWLRQQQSTGLTTILSLNQSLLLNTDNAVRGDIMSCAVTAEDAHGLQAESSTSVEVANTAPEIVAIGLTPTAPAAVDDITCSVSSLDSDLEPITLDYDWRVDGVLQSADTEVFSEILAAGSEVTCTVTPTDGLALGAAQSATVTVVNSPPIINDVLLTPTDVYTDDVLSAGIDVVDYDGDNLTHIYTWYVNGINVQSGYSSSLNGVYRFSKGDEIILEVVASDGVLSSIPFVSEPITVLNSPPTLPEIDLGGIYYDSGNDLHCQLTQAAVDLDGDLLSYEFSWAVNGAPFTGITEAFDYANDAINYNDTNPQDIWLCSLTVSDGIDTLNPVTAETLVTSCEVQNTYNLFDDILNSQNCWQTGYATTEDSLTLQSFSLYNDDAWSGLAFDDFDFSYYDPSDSRINATGWQYWGNGWPSAWNSVYDGILLSTDLNEQSPAFDLGMSCGSPYASSCRTRMVALGEQTVHLHPGQNSTFLRWQAPLSGDCEVQLELIGSEDVSSSAFPNLWPPAETATTVSLMHNHSLVNSAFIESYLFNTQMDESMTVQGGDILDIVVTGNQSLAEWTGVSGLISCSY